MSLATLTSKIDKTRLPRHIAIIMDGNGRWARRRGLPRVEGHRVGVRVVDNIVTCCRELGIKALTLYSFSSENWKRPPAEVMTLMKILKKYLVKELDRMVRENIRLNLIGRLDDLPDFARLAALETSAKTRENTGMILTLALSYGSRDEIARAARKLAVDAQDGLVKPDEINEETFSSYLDTRILPDPDLLIRTSGELRISNFMLWQIAYTELYFTDKLWPEFTVEDIAEAIISYQTRERRYGKTTSQLSSGRG